MKESAKLERALQSMPWEVIVQHSNGTDDIEVLAERATEAATEENTSVLNVLLTYAKETLETYEGGGDNRHVNYEMKEDDPETWKTERSEIKQYIKKLEKYIKG